MFPCFCRVKLGNLSNQLYSPVKLQRLLEMLVECTAFHYFPLLHIPSIVTPCSKKKKQSIPLFLLLLCPTVVSAANLSQTSGYGISKLLPSSHMYGQQFAKLALTCVASLTNTCSKLRILVAVLLRWLQVCQRNFSDSNGIRCIG